MGRIQSYWRTRKRIYVRGQGPSNSLSSCVCSWVCSSALYCNCQISGRVMGKIPCAGRRFLSFQLLRTSSQVKSSRTRNRTGSLGFLEAKRNPWCLKLTMSPGLGFHLLANPEVPGEAKNRIPFGLAKLRVSHNRDGRARRTIHIPTATHLHSQLPLPQHL